MSKIEHLFNPPLPWSSERSPKFLRGGIRRAVPKGFPFFHVEWEDGGYAQIIEGEVRVLVMLSVSRLSCAGCVRFTHARRQLHFAVNSHSRLLGLFVCWWWFVGGDLALANATNRNRCALSATVHLPPAPSAAKMTSP